MAYIGRGINNLSNAQILDTITFTGSAGPYDLEQGSAAFTPISPQALVISIDGVIQAPGSYTISSATITFDTSMASTSTNDFIVHNGVGLITTPADGVVTAAKLATDAVETAKIKDLNVTAGKLAATQDLSTKTITLPATVAGLGTGIDVTSQITGVVPTANLGSGTASSSTYLAGDQTYQTMTEYDDSVLQSNIAMLGFKVAVNGSLTRYNLVDQSIDEFYDTSGIDASASTNEDRIASGSNFYYTGGSAPTRTQDADDSGVDGSYTWFKWTDTSGTGSYSADAAETGEFLVVAGGGGGGGDGNTVGGAGGGAGGLRASYGSTSGGGASAESDLSLGSGVTYTMTVGAGGTGRTSQTDNGSNGGVSSISGSDITDITTVGGGRGGYTQFNIGTVGGSGGGNSYLTSTPAAGTASQGYSGGTGSQSGGAQSAGGGGGGAAGAGANSALEVAANGGAGLDITITGSSVGYAGGGASGPSWPSGGTLSTATHGGGAPGTPYGNNTGGAGTANTGGGGGGAAVLSTGNSNGGNGGSGVVILRVLTGATGLDLTLQSTDVTAESAPTHGEFVTLIENAYGTATLNTDIKGYISRDSGVTFTQGTLVDEGSWGTNKQVLGFHDLALGGSALTAMCYKITTHNQSPSSLETRIYATSIGWR